MHWKKKKKRLYIFSENTYIHFAVHCHWFQVAPLHHSSTSRKRNACLIASEAPIIETIQWGGSRRVVCLWGSVFPLTHTQPTRPHACTGGSIGHSWRAILHVYRINLGDGQRFIQEKEQNQAILTVSTWGFNITLKKDTSVPKHMGKHGQALNFFF